MNNDFETSLLTPDEREELEFIRNLIPEQDRQGMTDGDIMFVLDASDDYLEEKGLLHVDDDGEVTYEDGDVDETEQLEYVLKAVRTTTHHAHTLTSVQVQLIMDGDLQFGIEKGWYEDN